MNYLTYYREVAGRKKLIATLALCSDMLNLDMKRPMQVK